MTIWTLFASREPHLSHLNPIAFQKTPKITKNGFENESKRFVYYYKSAEKLYFKPKNNNLNFLSKLGL